MVVPGGTKWVLAAVMGVGWHPAGPEVKTDRAGPSNDTRLCDLGLMT